jgi:hypothetical protein
VLFDLDELVLRCPDPRSRAYIKEAVACYKTGAYRSAVVSTWIALAFDLIDKIRFLAGAGDAEAKKNIDPFDKISSSGDIAAALAFEKSLLDLAKDKLELISHSEYLDLRRVVEDRNRCAHPSHTSGAVTFDPPSELARLHIVNAVNYVLSQQPAQGKAALSRLVSDLQSRSFPSKPEEVRTYLQAGPLGKPRRSLLRNYVVVLIKGLLNPVNDYTALNRFRQALKCVLEIHPSDAASDLAAELNRTVAHADDTTLVLAVKRLRDDVFWSCLETPQRIRLAACVENLPGDDLDDTELLIGTPLEVAAEKRLAKATTDEILNAFWMEVPAAAMTRLLQSYRVSQNYAVANKLGKFFREQYGSLLPTHVEAIVVAASSNSEVKESIEFPKVLHVIANRSPDWKARVNRLLHANGLGDLEIA